MKLGKLDKYFPDDMEPEATVTLRRKRGVSTLEVTINADGTLFRSEVDSDDFRSAMDKTIDNIERQIRRLARRVLPNVCAKTCRMNPSSPMKRRIRD